MQKYAAEEGIMNLSRRMLITRSEIATNITPFILYRLEMGRLLTKTY